MTARIYPTGFEAFWRAYLDTHRHPLTRVLHYVATLTGLGSVSLGLALLNPLPPLIGIPLGYALALGSHRWIERAPSLVTVNVLYGVRADLRMCALALRGRIAPEYARLGLGQPAPRQKAIRGQNPVRRARIPASRPRSIF